MGRWGNATGQFAFARSIAERLGCRLECPTWQGSSIFVDAAGYPHSSAPLASLAVEAIPRHPAAAIHGFYQFQEAFDQMKASELRKWLAIKPELLKRWQRPRKFYVAAHVRRGDYLKLKDRYAVIARQAYSRAIKAAGYKLDDVVWVSDEMPRGAGIFHSLPFLHDFITLMNADVIFRANSTFSFWAAALGTGKKFSPNVGEQVGDLDDVEFVEGNHCANFSTKIHTRTIHGDTHLPE
jgi:hypothetical protein